MERLWATILQTDMQLASTDVSDELYWYVTVTAASGAYWWADDMMVEKDVTKPGDAIIHTRGTAVTNTTDAAQLTVVKVCPDCKERLHKVSDLRGKPRREIEAPVDVDIQEL
jgi:hypothetical protein